LALHAQHDDIGLLADASKRTVLPHIDRRYRQHGCAPPFRCAVICTFGEHLRLPATVSRQGTCQQKWTRICAKTGV